MNTRGNWSILIISLWLLLLSSWINTLGQMHVKIISSSCFWSLILASLINSSSAMESECPQDHQQHQNGNDFVLLLDAVAWCRITSALFSCCAAAAELCLYCFVSWPRLNISTPTAALRWRTFSRKCSPVLCLLATNLCTNWDEHDLLMRQTFASALRILSQLLRWLSLRKPFFFPFFLSVFLCRIVEEFSRLFRHSLAILCHSLSVQPSLFFIKKKLHNGDGRCSIHGTQECEEYQKASKRVIPILHLLEKFLQTMWVYM